MAFYSDKIFPVEVENIKEYMDDTYTTNINGGMNSDYNTLDNIENEADGKINIQKIRYSNGANRRGIQNRMRGGCKF
jgi:expansin (peptidoglycan-binding protein)